MIEDADEQLSDEPQDEKSWRQAQDGGQEPMSSKESELRSASSSPLAGPRVFSLRRSQ